MIVYKWWRTTDRKVIYTYIKTWEGYFLLWFIPLYIRLVKEERS